MNRWIITGISATILICLGILIVVTNNKSSSPVFEDTSQETLPTEKPAEQQVSNTDMYNNLNNTSLPKPELTIDLDVIYQVTLKTSEGDIVIELDSKNTPITANNFIYLAEKDFYDNTVFHRVISGFMIQGGDPTGTGMGSPGYRFEDEPITKDYVRGTVAMANSGPNTNGSQFFIMHADYALPKNYVIFGQVVEGLDVVDKIAGSEVKTSPNGEKSSPISPATILDVIVSSK